MMICGVGDLGSNTIRLAIYRCEQGKIQRLFHKKAMAGLAGYVADGALAQKGIHIACEVLTSYRELAEHFQIDQVHVFATASIRNISNSAV